MLSAELILSHLPTGVLSSSPLDLHPPVSVLNVLPRVWGPWASFLVVSPSFSSSAGGGAAELEQRLSVFFSAILTHVGCKEEQQSEVNSDPARPLRKCAIREGLGSLRERLARSTLEYVRGND